MAGNSTSIHELGPQTWKYPHGTACARGASGSAMASLSVLLESLPSLLPALLMDSTVSFSLNGDTAVKKLYMKAVRIIHPDKIPGGYTNC